MADIPSFQGLPKQASDPLQDPDFLRSTPEQKHAYLSRVESPGYDADYAKAPSGLQQKYLSTLQPKTGTFGEEQLPTRVGNGEVMPQNRVQRAVAPVTDAVQGPLLATILAAASGGTTRALGGGGAAQSLARMLGAGTVTGANAPGSMGDKLEAGGKGALWAGGGELAARLANAIATSPMASKFGSRMAARPADPGTPPSNPITSATVLHDMGSQQPAGSPAAPTHILDPQGRAVSTIQAPVVARNLQTAAPGTPTPVGPAKDLLVTRTPSPGTPATPENLLSKILRSGAPAGAAQDENVQSGMALSGKALWDALQGVGYRLGIGRDPNHTGGGG